MSHWGISITNIFHIDIDQRNSQYPTRPVNEQLKLWLTDADGRPIYSKEGQKIPYKSIIDCGQLQTVSQSDVVPDRRYGKLKDLMMIRVDITLQSLLGGIISYNPYSEKELKVREGHVLLVNLPSMPNQRCLVISSEAIDALREKALHHVSVVPLVSEKHYMNSHGVATVDVPVVGNPTKLETVLAMCQEIYSIDWRSRRVNDPFAELSENSMSGLRLALRKYLDLPGEELLLNEKKTISPLG
jgi:mRNA-degrading endonuclease toxin of MazEF toxin-antitoxin module